MIKSNLKRRRVQNITIGISIAIVSLLFSTSVGILKSIQQPFDKVFNDLNASHILLLYDFRSDNTNALSDWFSEQPEVERVSRSTPYFSCNGPLFFKDEKIDVLVQITEYTEDHLRQDKLKIINGEAKDQPGYGEIWLPNYLAVQHNIYVGDTIAIPASGGIYKFKVSATVSDPLYGSGMVNPTRAWVRAGSLSFFVPVSQLTDDCLGIRLRSPELVTSVLNRFNKDFNFSGTILNYDLFKSAFTSTYQLIGGIIFIFSILALIICVFIINTAITKTIYDDYKLTGILKTLGFTPRGTTSIFIINYFFLAIIFIPIGFAGTYFILRLLIQSLMRTIGEIDLDLQLLSVFSVTFFALLAIILLTSIIGGIKAGKIKPVEAIRFGAPEKNKHSGKLRGIIAQSFYSLLMLLSIRFILEDKRRALVSFSVLLFTVFILAFSVNITFSLSGLKYNKAAWGFENSDIQLSRNATVIGLTHQQFKEMLQNEKGISAITPFSYENLTVLSNDGNHRINLIGKVYEGDVSKTGLVNLSGRHPVTENEIALCVGTSKQLNKVVGDSILVFIEGQKVNFLITGVYQDISNMGQGFRLSSTAIEKLNPVYIPNLYSLKLFAGIQAEQYKNYLLKTLGEMITIDTNIEDRIQQIGIVSNMEITFLILSLFFITILALSLWNDVIISIRDYRRTFGILKAAGFTPKELRKLLCWKMMLLTSFSLIAGIPLTLWLSPVLMSAVTKNLGLIHFPFVVNTTGMLLIIPLFFSAVIACTWISSAGAAKVNPRILLIE